VRSRLGEEGFEDYALLGWLLLGVELGAGVTVVLLYAVLLALLVSLAMAYYELVLPYLEPRNFSPSQQVLCLALLALGLLGAYSWSRCSWSATARSTTAGGRLAAR
jgi:hypothetical protein